MNIAAFRKYISNELKDLGFDVYFGHIYDYNQKRDKKDKAIVIRENRINLARKEACYADTALEIYVTYGRPVDQEQQWQRSGEDTQHKQEMLDICGEIYDKIFAAGKITVTVEKEKVQMNYWSNDQNQTVNSEAVARMEIAIRYYYV